MNIISEKLYSKERIKKKNEIKLFFANRNVTRFLYSKKRIYSIIVKPNNFTYSRFAVSIKKNKGNSPVRNKAKRQVREIFRRNKSSIPMGYDYFVIVNSAHKLPFNKRVEYFISALQKVCL